MTHEWPSADAWLLLSVHYSRKVWRRSIPLRPIIGAADAINHAIPTEEEFDGAARRLSAAGLLNIEEDRVSLTRSGRRLMRSVKAKSWLDEWDRLVKTLGELRLPDAEIGQGLPPAAYERAVTSYLRDHGMVT